MVRGACLRGRHPFEVDIHKGRKAKAAPPCSCFCLSVFCRHRRGLRGLFCDFNNVKYANPLRFFHEYNYLCTPLRYNQFHSRSFLPVLLVRPVGIGCVLYALCLCLTPPDYRHLDYYRLHHDQSALCASRWSAYGSRSLLFACACNRPVVVRPLARIQILHHT